MADFNEIAADNLKEIAASLKAGVWPFMVTTGGAIIWGMPDLWEVIGKVVWLDLAYVISLVLILVVGISIQFFSEYRKGLRGHGLFISASVSFVTRTIIYAAWVVVGLAIAGVISVEIPDLAPWIVFAFLLAVVSIEGSIVMRATGMTMRSVLGFVRITRNVATGRVPDEADVVALDDVANAVQAKAERTDTHERPKQK